MSLGSDKSVVILGGRLLGITAAIEIKKRYPDIGVTLIEKSTFITSDNHILDKSATVSSTKTLHSGTYYTHRGHSRGEDRKEMALLDNLTEETSRVYKSMMDIMEHYGILPDEKDSYTVYLMFQDAFIEPDYFESITKEKGIWLEKVPDEEFERLKKIFLKYNEQDGKPMVLNAAFYTKDALTDLLDLLKCFEKTALELGINLVEQAKIIGIENDGITVDVNGRKEKFRADCIVNATNAFTTPTAHMISAEPPPKDSYIIQYRHYGSISKEAAPIFNEVTQGKMSFFRLFHGHTKNTFSEFVGDRSRVSLYAPELTKIPNDKPHEVFNIDSKKDKSLRNTFTSFGINPDHPSFQGFIGLTSYTQDAKNLYHESKTETGIPVMNAIIEKMSGFIDSSPVIADWVADICKGKLNVTIVGAGHYGRELIGPKYKSQKRVRIKSVISPTASIDSISKSPLGDVDIFRSVEEWIHKNGQPSEVDVFDLAVHHDVLPRALRSIAEIGGRNFILPKPVAIKHDELKEIMEIKNKYGLNMVVASQWYYSDMNTRLLQLVDKIKNKYGIKKIEVDFSQNFENDTKYTPTTAMLPHIIQILYSAGVISEKSSFDITEANRDKISLKIAGKIPIFIKTCIKSDRKCREVKIFYVDGEEKTAVIDYLGLIKNGRWIHYPSITFESKTREVVGDVLNCMINKIVDGFINKKIDNNDELMTLDKYTPVSEIQIKIEEKYRNTLTD